MRAAPMGTRSGGGPDRRGFNNPQPLVPDQFRTPRSCGCPERNRARECEQATCNWLVAAMVIPSPPPEKMEESLFRSPGIISTVLASDQPEGVNLPVSVSVWCLAAAAALGAIPGTGNNENAIVSGDLYRTTRISRHCCPAPRLRLPRTDKAHWRPIGPGSAAIGARLDSKGPIT